MSVSRDLERVAQHAQQPKPACGFCQGKPVRNAATWADGKPRPPAACPRCGETHTDEGGAAAA